MARGESLGGGSEFSSAFWGWNDSKSVTFIEPLPWMGRLSGGVFQTHRCLLLFLLLPHVFTHGEPS